MTRQRSLWKSLGTLHAVVYFDPGVADAYRHIGLRGYWSGYFASRSAALGTPSARVVTALFHGFAPTMVERAIPDAWTLADPAAILEVRTRLATDALQRCLPAQDFKVVVDDLRKAGASLDFGGKPLAAAHADCAEPADQIGALWQAATVLREYRGDVHIAVLTACEMDGVTANALQVAVGAAPTDQKKTRGWDDESWCKAVERLVARGWAEVDGRATERGRHKREEIETMTDAACGKALDTLSPESAATIMSIAQAISAADAVPWQAKAFADGSAPNR